MTSHHRLALQTLICLIFLFLGLLYWLPARADPGLAAGISSAKIVLKTPPAAPTATPDREPALPIPPPTLAFDLQERWYSLLKTNGSCDLPCFLGVTPGQTYWKNARPFFESFGRTGPILPYPDGSNKYSFLIDTTKDVDLDLFFNLETEGDRVQRIITHITVSRDGTLVGDDAHLSGYGLSEVFLEFGPPDAIYVGGPSRGGYWIAIFYDRLKFMIQYGGNARRNESEGYTLCPNIGEGDITSLKIAVAGADDPVDIRKYSLIDFQSEEYASSIGRVLGLSVNDFYRTLTRNPQACFKAKPSRE